MNSAVTEIFKDLKVIELAGVLAGPAVGMFFSELGAKVIKIENKRTKGDITRRWKQENENKESNSSAYFSSVNWNKEHLFLDLREDTDKKKAMDLILDADILISNFKNNSAKKMNFHYEHLKSKNEKLIYAQISGFPQDENRPAFDVVLQAETSYLSMCGTKEGVLTKMPVALIDVLTAHQLKEAILIALIKRFKTGKGSFVSTSLFETAVSSLVNQASNFLNNGNVAVPLGTEHPNIAPYGEMIKCKDGKHIVLAVGTESQFLQLGKALDLEGLAIDDRFSNNVNRIQNRNALFAILQEKFKEKDHKKWEQILNTHAVPFGILKTIKEVLSDPFVLQNMILEDEKSEGRIMKRLKTNSFKIQ